MKFTRASSYAIHAAVHLARGKDSKPIPSHVMAETASIPERFLLKVLKPLVSARVLHSVKGPHGGYRLAKAPKDVTLLEIVEAVDGPIRGHAPLADVGSLVAATPLDRTMQGIADDAAALVRNRLQKTTLLQCIK